MKRTLLGTSVALGVMAALTAAMLPIRDHLAIATTALVLVVPVVIGVVTGGFVAGVLSVIAGFLAYDLLFIPPFLTLSVGVAQNWVVLAVYAAVMLPVSRVVANMNSARSQARRQGRELRELFELSYLLVEDKPLDLLLTTVVSTVAEVFSAPQVALVLPTDRGLDVAASRGDPLTPDQLRRFIPESGELAHLDPRPHECDGLLVIALVASGRPIGLLVLSGDAAHQHLREPLLLFANHIALAVERAQLREQALQARLAEEVTRLASTLVTAVSHDLRAPLSRIKASSSMLADDELDIDPVLAHDLATLIDAQADRLAGLVQNLLDMSRIQAGVLQPRYSIVSLHDLVSDVVGELGPDQRDRLVRVEIPGDLPPVDADPALVSRVLANLLQNALRFSPKGQPVTISATLDGDSRIVASVADRGPGVSRRQRHDIFEQFTRREGDAGAGLGLTIAKTFVEAHGQSIWVENAPGGGAIFSFTLATPAAIHEEQRLVADTHH